MGAPKAIGGGGTIVTFFLRSAFLMRFVPERGCNPLIALYFLFSDLFFSQNFCFCFWAPWKKIISRFGVQIHPWLWPIFANYLRIKVLLKVSQNCDDLLKIAFCGHCGQMRFFEELVNWNLPFNSSLFDVKLLLWVAESHQKSSR
jgi:hypothetical protein